MSTTYAERYHTDPSITDEELTPAVLEEVGQLKHAIIQAVLPHFISGPADDDGVILDMLALELEPCTPDFIRALHKALQK